jgi:hypothetical protein
LFHEPSQTTFAHTHHAFSIELPNGLGDVYISTNQPLTSERLRINPHLMPETPTKLNSRFTVCFQNPDETLKIARSGDDRERNPTTQPRPYSTQKKRKAMPPLRKPAKQLLQN